MAEIGRQGGERREKKGSQRERIDREEESQRKTEMQEGRDREKREREITNEVLLNHRHCNSGRACRRPVLNAEISPQLWSQGSWV